MSTLRHLVPVPITTLFIYVFSVTGAGANTVIHYDDSPTVVTFGTTGGIDLDKNGQADFNVDLSPSFTLYSTGSSGFEIANSGGYVSLHWPDVLVNSDLDYASASSINTGEWLVTGGGMIAYRFQYQETLAYGWAQVVMSGFDAHITTWAFDPSGASILTGATVSAVPEPSTYAAIFGVSALGLAAWRKRRHA